MMDIGAFVRILSLLLVISGSAWIQADEIIRRSTVQFERGNGHAIPKFYIHTNSIYGEDRRGAILSKLHRIRLASVKWDGLPLTQALLQLYDEVKRRDPEGRGVNFLISPGADETPLESLDSVGRNFGQVDVGAAVPAPMDTGAVLIRIDPPLIDARLEDVLDAIVKVSPEPIKYSVVEYAVVFSPRRDRGPIQLRSFKVHPIPFRQVLESVTGFPAIEIAAGTRQVSVTYTNGMDPVQSAVRHFLTLLGLEMKPPSSAFFNSREGALIVHATQADLNVVEAAVEVLQRVPPDINPIINWGQISSGSREAADGNLVAGNSGTKHQAGESESSRGGPLPVNNGVSAPTSAEMPAGKTPTASVPDGASRQPPVLGIVRVSPEQVIVVVDTSPGQTFVLQSSQNLVNWDAVATNTMAASRWVYTNASVQVAPRLFFRTVLLNRP